MTDRPAEPFYLDVLTRKHEAYSYDESESSIVEVEHQGRIIRLIVPEYSLPRVLPGPAAIEGDVLFLIGKQLSTSRMKTEASLEGVTASWLSLSASRIATTPTRPSSGIPSTTVRSSISRNLSVEPCGLDDTASCSTEIRTRENLE